MSEEKINIFTVYSKIIRIKMFSLIEESIEYFKTNLYLVIKYSISYKK